MVEHAKNPAGNGPRLDHRDLVGTLYGSFGFAQGELRSSYDILELSSDYYKGKYPQQSITSAVESISNRGIVNHLSLPPRHTTFETETRDDQPKQTVEERVQEEFTTFWNFFSQKLSSPDRLPVQNRLQLVSSMCLQLTKVDQTHMQLVRNGEPYNGRASKPNDRRFSMLREHVLMGKKLGNAALDSVLGQAQSALRSIDNYQYYDGRTRQICSALVNQELPILAAAWEAHHPGQRFVEPHQYPGTLLLASAQSRPPSVSKWMAENMAPPKQ